MGVHPEMSKERMLFPIARVWISVAVKREVKTGDCQW